jgi:amidase
MQTSATQLWQLDAAELAALIRHGQVSSREAMRSALDRIHAVNPAVNAVVRVLEEEAMAAADAADVARARGDRLGPLHGVPVTTKINVDQAGLPTDNGVPELKDFIAPVDGPVAANLKRAGAVIIGRTNSPAFAMRGHTDNALHGPTLNPWNPQATPGGSSGGAGVAAAVGLGTIAQGNDIGGSIRWPAYCNGVLGLRPTTGRVAHINPSAPAGRSLGAQLMAVNGPLARSVRDLRLALEVMSAPDLRDNRWTPVPLELPPPTHPLKVALVTSSQGPAVQPAVWAAVRQAGRYLQAAGYQVEEVEIPFLHATSELWHAIGVTEQFHVLGPMIRRYSDPGIRDFLEPWWELRPPLDLPGYLAALARRDALMHEWQMFHQDYPIVVMPSSPQRPVPAGIDVQGLEGTRLMLEALYFQLTLPVIGQPGLAVPVGMDGDLPMGVQLVAARWREDLLLQAAEVIEACEGVRRPIDPRPAPAVAAD